MPRAGGRGKRGGSTRRDFWFRHGLLGRRFRAGPAQLVENPLGGPAARDQRGSGRRENRYAKQLHGLSVAPRHSAATQKSLRFWRHVRLEINAQSLGNAVDVVEVTDDLGGIADGSRRKARSLQRGHIGGAGFVRIVRKLFRPGTQGCVGRGQPRATPVALERLSLFIILDFSPEVRPVGFGSVVATVGAGDHRGQHFPLRARQV